MPKLLLLSCCAPCSCAIIEKLAQERRDFAVLFYNPNIVPFAEYQKRCEENKKICELYEVDFIELEYDNQTWLETIKGLENEPERGARCSLCFHLRLKKALAYAKQNGFSEVSSVLGASRYKDLSQVNAVALIASQEVDVPYVELELRKNGMQERANVLLKELNLYHQDYCGCKPRC